MAFKLNYLFEGNTKNKPEQNLSGSSKKLSRDALLQVTHEERRKRQEQRLKLQSAEILQSHIRSYIVRKYKKQEERALFDAIENTGNMHVVLSKLLFFYDLQEDNTRLLSVAVRLVSQYEEVLKQMEIDVSFNWLMKRLLIICLRRLYDEDPNMNKVFITTVHVFAKTPNILEYLIRKGYYRCLHVQLERRDDLEKIIDLIKRPFKFMIDKNFSNIVSSEFCLHFLKSDLTYKMKNVLIPNLKADVKYNIYRKLVEYLNGTNYFLFGTNLFYYILALEPEDFEPTLSSIQVLSKSSRNLHTLNISHRLNSDDSDDDDDVEIIEEHELLSDCLSILNLEKKVAKWLLFLERNMDNDDVLLSYVHWCHNLLLIYKDSLNRYLLLCKLGLNGRFLNKLWLYIQTNYSDQLQTRGLYQNSWSECHTVLSVCSKLFIFYTETLTDKENSDTSGTFTKEELFFMSKLLKKVARDIIEIVFPMSKAISIPPSVEMHHLYKVCLNCVRTLYMLDLREEFCPAGFWTSEKIFIPPELSRNNYLSQSLLSTHMHGYQRSNEDEQLPPLSTIEQRSLAVLAELPFLIPFNTRVLLLRDLCRYSFGDIDFQSFHNDYFNDRFIVIRRTHLYEDAFEKISSKNDSDLRHKLRIQFVNSIGLEEVGIDGGGIFKEFINEVLKTAFDPNRGFFLLTADNTLYPNPNVHLIVENYMEHYKFIGRLIGKAIFENILVDLPLAEFFLAKLLVDKASAHYLKSLDPVLYKNLLFLRDYSGDISDLGLDFTIVNNDLGETRVVELKPDGRNIPVTNDNRLQYIQKLANLKLNIQLKKQCAAFRDGLNSVVPIEWLKLFSHKELQIIIGGNNQEVDIEDLRHHTVYGGEFTEDHPTIILFWKIVSNFTDVQKKQLLKFVTSCSRPPLLGFKELNPQFSIQSSGVENRMPTASTCLNLLKIPIMKEEEILRNKILEAIEQQAGFELS